MAITTKNSNIAWTTATGWSLSPSATLDGIVDAAALPTTAFTHGTASLILASLKIDAAYTATSLSATSGTDGTVLTSNSALPFNYTLYLAPNKTSFLIRRSLNFSLSGSPISHTVYIDSNSTLQANSIAQPGFTANVTKLGPGTWRLAATENDPSNSAAGPTSLIIQEGTVLTGSGVSSAAVAFNAILNGGTLQAGATRSFTNPITVNAAGGSVSAVTGVVATFNAAPLGSGTLTVTREGSGSVTWNNNISCPLNVTGLLTMGASNNLSGATLSGSGGTIAMSNGSISSDAPTFTGDVTGTFTYNATGGRTFGGNAQGSVTVTGGTLTATASNSGTIANISGGAGVTLSSNGTFTGDLGGYTFLGSSPSAGVATLSMVGPTTTFARNLSLTNGSRVRLSQSATLTSPVVVTNIDTTTTEMTVEDATTNTFTGSYISNVSLGSDNISAVTDGTLVLSGSVDGRQAGRTWQINGSGEGYTGTIKLTGTGFTGAAPASLKRGKLVMQRAGAIGLAGGLTIDSGATLACATPSAAYAAQLSGNLTLSAGSFMKFGTA